MAPSCGPHYAVRSSREAPSLRHSVATVAIRSRRQARGGKVRDGEMPLHGECQAGEFVFYFVKEVEPLQDLEQGGELL